MEDIMELIEHIKNYKTDNDFVIEEIKYNECQDIVLQMSITYKQACTHTVLIKNLDGELFWFVEPYRTSYFSGKFNYYPNLDVVLHAIKLHAEG